MFNTDHAGLKELTHNALRIVAGFLFVQHGAQKLFGVLGREAVESLIEPGGRRRDPGVFRRTSDHRGAVHAARGIPRVGPRWRWPTSSLTAGRGFWAGLERGRT